MLVLIFIILTIILLLYIFAISPRFTRRRDMRRYRHTMFAHRGYHCIEKGIPENSMAAFSAALGKGYGIEIDLHLTRDGRLVVFHDDTLERLCGRPDTVENLTYEEVKSCRLCGTAETIPSFDEVLSLVKGRVPLLIELKIPDSSMYICRETMRCLSHYQGPCLIQSFNTIGIRWFKLNAPHILRGQLSSNLTRDPLKEAWLFRFMVKHLLSNFLGRPDFISYNLNDLPIVNVWILKHIFHVPVAVWTLNTPDMLKKGSQHFDMQIFEKRNENSFFSCYNSD